MNKTFYVEQQDSESERDSWHLYQRHKKENSGAISTLSILEIPSEILCSSQNNWV